MIYRSAAPIPSCPGIDDQFAFGLVSPEALASLADRHTQGLALEEQLRYESLLADVSARFVNIPADEVDAALEDSQRLVCDQLRLDRSSLFQVLDDDPNVLLLTHLHQPTDGPGWQKRPAPRPLFSSYWAQTDETPPSYVCIDCRKQFPWVYEQIRAGTTVVLRSLDDLPREAATDRETFRRYRTGSSVMVPLSVGRTWLGLLSFAMLCQPRQWSEAQIRRFQSIGHAFANALARRRADLALRESEQRLQLATESADVGLWSLEAESRRVWVTDKTREILGCALHEQLTEQDFLARIHPEDHAGLREAIEESLRTGADLRGDCRVLTADGGVRWIVARGRPRRGAAGEPDCLTGVAIDITDRKRGEAELQQALSDLRALQERLRQENTYLRQEAQGHPEVGPIIGASDGLMKVIRQAEQVAATDSTVLILGETGTGKELLAQYIHRISRRSGKAFVATSIAAIPATLLESELFGREKGAYTGALTRERGRFEMADGGTLFLDEVGETPLETQAKLLRVLQTGEFERLGSGRTLRVDVRVIAATNRELPELIEAGSFRRDLFYRLNVFPVTLPPLRNRREDIPLLVWTFVKELSEKMSKPVERIPDQDMAALQEHDWPGNVRELRNVVERSMILMDGPELRLVLPGGPAGSPGRSSRLLVDVQRRHVLEVLESAANRIYGTGGAAEILGIKPTTLYSLMARLGIPRRR